MLHCMQVMLLVLDVIVLRLQIVGTDNPTIPVDQLF